MPNNPNQGGQGPSRRRAPAPEQAPRTAQEPRRRRRRRGPRNTQGQNQNQNQNQGNERQGQDNQGQENRGQELRQNNQRLNKKRITQRKREILKNKFLEVFQDIQSINRQFEKVGLNPVDSIDEAVETLKGLWINICDFLEGKLITFDNERDLRNYTRKNKKFFPKNVAKHNNLQHFLIKML